MRVTALPVYLVRQPKDIPHPLVRRCVDKGPKLQAAQRGVSCGGKGERLFEGGAEGQQEADDDGQNGVQAGEGARKTGVPIHIPSILLQDESSHHDPRQQEAEAGQDIADVLFLRGGQLFYTRSFSSG